MTDEIDKAASRNRRTRQDRLKSLLRENLKRRKVQARERSHAADPSQDDTAPFGDGDAAKTGE